MNKLCRLALTASVFCFCLISCNSNNDSDVDSSKTKPTLEKLSFVDSGGICKVKAIDTNIEGDVIIPAWYNNERVELDEGCFKNCKRITSISFEDGTELRSVPLESFYNCTSLQSINLPRRLSYISESAFEKCVSLKSILLPESCHDVSYYAFFGCTSLTSIDVDTSNQYFSSKDGVLLNKTGNSIVCCPPGKKGIFVIDDSIKNIKYGAFFCSPYIVSFSVDSENLYLSDLDGALLNKQKTELICCPGGMKDSFTIPSSVTKIGADAFDGSSLSSIDVDSNSNSFASENGVLCNKGKTRLIRCPIEKAGTFVIPNTVEDIEPRAFSYCRSLESVEFETGSNIRSIGERAFVCCYSIKTIAIPSTVNTIGELAFAYCQSLFSINLPDSITSIGQSAFYDCTSLEFVQLSNNITIIDYDLFYGCTSLKSITIPSKVHTIKEYSFNYCLSLETVNFCSHIGYIGNGTFLGCSNLVSFYLLDDSNTWYYASDSVLFFKHPDENDIKLVCYPAGKTGNYSIPEGVVSLESYAFCEAYRLHSITIPTSVQKIGDYCFSDCCYLEEMNYDGSMNSWKNITKGTNWNAGIKAKVIHCKNGDIEL